MEEKRIYSLNLLAYLIANGIEPILCKDKENGKIYGVVQEDIGKKINEYKNDRDLHWFLDAYNFLRNKINDINKI